MKGMFVIYGYEFGALIMFRVGVSMFTMCGLKLVYLLCVDGVGPFVM